MCWTPYVRYSSTKFVEIFDLLKLKFWFVDQKCNRYGDCGAVHYCLNSYCEPCIPCKDMFNRQPAQSVSGMAICAKHEDDCGGCLPG